MSKPSNLATDLNMLMDAVRCHGANKTNAEILELVALNAAGQVTATERPTAEAVRTPAPAAWIWHYRDEHRSLRWDAEQRDLNNSDVPERTTPLYAAPIAARQEHDAASGSYAPTRPVPAAPTAPSEDLPPMKAPSEAEPWFCDRVDGSVVDRCEEQCHTCKLSQASPGANSVGMFYKRLYEARRVPKIQTALRVKQADDVPAVHQGHETEARSHVAPSEASKLAAEIMRFEEAIMAGYSPFAGDNQRLLVLASEVQRLDALLGTRNGGKK